MSRTRLQRGLIKFLAGLFFLSFLISLPLIYISVTNPDAFPSPDDSQVQKVVDKTPKKKPQKTVVKELEREEEKKPEPVKTEPITVTTDELIDALRNNALKASTLYKDKYVMLTGKLNNIDAQGDYFSLSPMDDEWSFDSIHCSIDEEHLSKVMEFNAAQEVTVTGTITDVGEILGYYLVVESIK